MSRKQALLFSFLLLTACQGGSTKSGAPPREDAGRPAPADASVTTGGKADAGDTKAGDAGDAQAGDAGDTQAGDAGDTQAGDAGDTQAGDAGAPTPGDAGTTPAPDCREVTFRYQDANARSVWVTGTFTSWATTPAQGAIEMTSVNGVWEATTRIETSGRHLYKFIVDGTRWIADPSATASASDGFGGTNSVLEVCNASTEVVSHRTDPVAGTFQATLRVRGVDPATARLTVDHEEAPAGSMSTSGDTIQIALANLARGIHDVRVEVGASRTLLKVYIGVSTDWRDSTIYFVMTDRFKNGDPMNDAPVSGPMPMNNYLGGDFEGIRQAIESGYFDELGVSALWLTWPLENTDNAWSGPYRIYSGCQMTGESTAMFAGYHGYWPTSTREVESRFGTLEELRRVVNAAHARGIRVLLDFAANHMHRDSPLVSEHPEWFNQPAVLCRDGHWDSELREECWFDSFLPDWNYSNPDARRAVLDDAEWVSVEVGADGLRVDALKHMQDSFINELRARMSAVFEQTGVRFYMVGETFTGDPGLISAYVNPNMMDGQFDFPANMAILQGFANDALGLGDMHRTIRGIKARYGAAGPMMSNFVGNHDIARFVSKASGDLPCGIWSQEPDQSRAYGSPPGQPNFEAPYRRLQMALAYTYALPGIPLLYYGDEVGLAGAGDPDNRRMLPEDSTLNDFQRATKAFVAKLAEARRTSAALRNGEWTDALVSDASVLVFARRVASDQALVVINRGPETTVRVPVGSLGLASGTALTPKLMSSTPAMVMGQEVVLNVPAMTAEIYVTPPVSP